MKWTLDKKFYVLVAVATSVCAGFAGKLSDEDDKKWQAAQLPTSPQELLSDYLAMTAQVPRRVVSPTTAPKRVAPEAPSQEDIVRERVKRGDAEVVAQLVDGAVAGHKPSTDLLVGFEHPAAVAAIRELVRSHDPARAVAGLTLARRRMLPGCEEDVILQLHAKDAKVCAGAARTLKALGSARSVPALVAALENETVADKAEDALIAIALRDGSARRDLLMLRNRPRVEDVYARLVKTESRQEADDGFTWLFDGTDAWEGLWHGNEGWWENRNGLLTAESTPERKCQRSSFLVSNLVCQDFDWRLEIRLSEDGNSGLQFRSLDDPTGATGVQGDINGSGKWKMRHVGVLLQKATKDRKDWILSDRGMNTHWGADKTKVSETKFADEAELLKYYRPGEWNEYRVLAEGPHIRTYVNGVLFSEMVDEWPGYVKKGNLALQMHPGPLMKVEFRNVRVKVLDR